MRKLILHLLHLNTGDPQSKRDAISGTRLEEAERKYNEATGRLSRANEHAFSITLKVRQASANLVEVAKNAVKTAEARRDGSTKGPQK